MSAARTVGALLLVGVAGVWAAGSSVAAGTSEERGEAVPVVVETSHGSFVIELYPELAPRTVSRFLQRTDRAASEDAVDYAGLRVCESRPHGYLIFGCLPPEDPAVGPRAPAAEPPIPDEIDAVEMGLDERTLNDPVRIDWLWQQEIYPRYRKLRAKGEGVPEGLRELLAAVREQGPQQAIPILRGKSWLEYLRAIGYEFDPAGSPLRFERGAVATASYWPGQADARFLIALTRIPERDGRATVFGRVVSGWEAIDRILEVPLDKSNVPREPVLIESVRRR
jgi:cyclophilin family peptidyl-prolyl cis-trans isomerase